MDIEKIAKKVLRKHLKKIIYDDSSPLNTNIARFEWVYNSPLNQWEDRIWVIKHCPGNRDNCLNEYLYS